MDLNPPPKPAIIRPAPAELRRDWRRTPAREASFAPGWFPAGAAGPKGESTAKAFAYIANGTTSTNQTAHSFTLAVGAPHSTRIVLAAIYSQAVSGTLTHSGVTIGGVAASLVAENANGNARLGLYRAALPAGSTAAVAWTTSASATNSGAMTFRMVNLASPAPSDTASSSGTGGSLAATLDAPAGGAILTAAITVANSTAIAWTNAAEQFEGATSDELRGTAALYLTPGATEANRAISATPVRVIVAGAWA